MIESKDLTPMYAHAKYSNSKDGVRNMATMAKSDLAISLEELDKDPWLFNVKNGTIDLRTGELREHRKEDFITKLAPVTFYPAADCPHWRQFLETTFDGDKELTGYIQRLVGYCLTGATEEHILPFLYGSGANGKSTFCETVLKLLGWDYAMKAPPDLLLAKRWDSHPTDRADLFGKRFVACVETEANRRMAEALVKELTGGDRLRARRMREDFWEFTPTHHVWLAGNHKPVVIGTDHGIWRRIKLIPFTQHFWDPDVSPEPGEERAERLRQDKKLPAKLKAELPGILNWALAGCRDWQQSGMREPLIVSEATRVYSDEMDAVSQFVNEHCERGDYITSAGDLYRKFQEATGDQSTTQNAFGARLKLMGFLNKDPQTGKEYRTNKGKRGWKGLRHQPQPAAEELIAAIEQT